MDVINAKNSEPKEIDWPAIIVIIIGTFMAILDGSIVNVALPRMMAIFGASADSAEWILTAYMLTLGVVMPLSGFLGDTFGYKRIYFLALAFFIFGSALCGMAWSANSMVLARVIQALGGGLLQPIGMAMIYKSCPRSKIGMVLGIWGISAMTAPAVGPTLGGYLVDYISWRMIFYINLPIGIINLFLAAILLKETGLVKGKQLDWSGMLFSVSGFTCLLLALSKGANHGWASPFIVSLLLIAGICLASLIANELWHPEPILDLRLFKNFVFTISNIITSILSIGLFGAIFLIPILLQSALGQTAMKTGLIVFPAALASGLVMPISGKIFDRYGAKAVSIVGLALVAWTTYILSGTNTLTSFSYMTFWLAIRGAGMGLCMMPVSVAGMNTVPPHLIGRASALTNVIRQISASFGIAMFTTIMQTRQIFHFANLAQSINMHGNDALSVQGILQGMATNLGINHETVSGLGISLIAKMVGKLSMIQAIDDCFIIATLTCVFGLLLCFLLKDNSRGGRA